MRLIDADALTARQWMVAYHPYKDNGTTEDTDNIVEETIKQCKDIVRNAPTVDAEPVRHCDWHVYASAYGNKVAKCSGCQTGFSIESMKKYRYCPYCGAVIDGTYELDFVKDGYM